MTLATKNGSIIVKDGRLVENCGCCAKAGCQQGSPFLPGAQSASIKVTLSNIRPTFSGATQIRPGGQWLDFLGSFTEVAQGVEIPLYLMWENYTNSRYSGRLNYDLITAITYNVGSEEREFPPSEFGYNSQLRCLYRRGVETNGYQVRKPGSDSGVRVPAYSVGWQVNGGVFIFVQGALTGAINFTPPGRTAGAWHEPRFATFGSLGSLLTAGGFYFTAGFAYQGFPNTQTIQSQVATNLFASAVVGTTYDWQYDITLSMQ
jgi:hypothetical protein